MGFMSMGVVVKVHRKGIIVLPKSVRDALNIVEGTLLELRVDGDTIVLRSLDLWDRVWGGCKGLGDVESFERELDFEEEEFWRRREKLIR